jgi:hypothetical protein
MQSDSEHDLTWLLLGEWQPFNLPPQARDPEAAVF